MSKIASFVVGALSGAAAMIGLAYWISEHEDVKGATSAAEESADAAAQEHPDQDACAQDQNGERDYEASPAV